MKLLTIKEAATALKVTEKTLRRWEEKKFITPIRTTGRHRRYSLEQLKSVKKFKNKKNVDISEVRHLLSNEIKQTFTNSPLTEINPVAVNKPNFAKSFALKYLAVILFSAGALTAYKIKSDQRTNISVFEPEVVSQSVLAATSFLNSEFSINIPTILNSTLTLGNDTISDFTGSGLSVVNGALTAEVSSLGDSIISSEIVDGTIAEVDLLASNTPSGSQYLSFNSTTGGFTWSTPSDSVGSNYFTDSGDTVYLTTTADDLVFGGSSPLSSAKLSIDGDSDQVQLIVQGNSTQSNKIFVVEKSDGTDIFSIDNDSLATWSRSSAGQWIAFNDGTDQWGLYNRAGTPEGFITANTGTLAMDTANGTLYVKTDDSDATGWVNLATGVSSPWTETAGLVTLGTTTSNVNVGGSSDLAKLAVDGDSDEIQFLVQGNSTQTANLAVFENSSGVDLLSLSNSGGLTIGSNGTDGTLTLYSEQGATDYSTVFQPGTQTENITYTLPVDNGAADNYVLTTDGTGTLAWESVGGIGGMSNFILSGDSGSDQTISDANTLEIAGGVTGIDTTTSATDVITLDIDTTEIGENTWGNNTDASIVWTFDQSGTTDPTLAFSDGLVTVGGDLAISGGNITTAVTFDSNVAITGSLTANGRLETAAHANNVGLNLTTNAGVPVAVTGTSEGDAVYDTVGNNLYIYDGGSFTQVGGGGYSGWTIDGDDADTESIASGNTLLVAGGTNGIDTDVSATDTITLNFDATEVGSVTFGSGSAITWTFDASAGTDPTITFGNNLVTVDHALTVTGTTTTNGTLTANGVVTLGDNGDTVAINSSDWDINTVGDATGIGALGLDGDITNTQSSPSILLVDSTATSDDFSINVDGSAFTIVNDTDTRTDISISGTGDVTLGSDLAINGGNITTALTLDSTLTVTGTITLNGATTANTDVDLSLAGTENFVITSGAPGADLTVISGGTSVTDGVDGLSLTFGVSAASGNVIDLTPSYADATAGATSETYNVIDIDAFTATQNASGDTGLIRAVNIGNLTQTETAGTLTANAIKIGTGWDSILDYNGTTVINGTGQVVSTQVTGTLFTLAGDTGSGTVAQGNTVTVAGGTNGIDTSEATTTVTLNLDTTEIGTTTFGSGSGITWTFDASAGTDTTLVFGDGLVTVGGDLAISGGNITTAVTFDSTLTVTGTSTLNGLTTVNDDFTVALTGNENVEITDGATPTTDTVSIVANGATVTTDANALEIDFTTGDGTDVTNSGLQIDMASGGTGAGDITNAINLSMDAADASTQKGINFADNNFDTDINATTDLTLGIGGTNELTLTTAALSPSTSDGNALGTTTLMWSDLFLASGAVINFDNGDVTLTHSANALAVAGGDVNIEIIDGQSVNIDGDTSPTADLLVLGASDVVATDGVDALSISFAAADGTDLTNSAINVSLTSTGTGAGDLMRGLFIDLASVANAASTNKAIEIENTTAWDVDIELQNDETIDNVTDGTITLTAPIVLTSAALTVSGTLTANGTVALGDNGDTVAINSSDWDIDATGAITGVSFDANGTGNSLSNVENADLVNDTLDWDKFIDSSSLDTDLAIAEGAGEEITINKAYTNNTSENGLVFNLTASDTGAGTTAQYGVYIDNLASTEGADSLITLNNSDADDAVGSAILFTAGGAGVDFTTGIDFSAANLNREIVLENGEAIIGQTADTITFEDDDGTDYATLSVTALTVAGDLAITGGNITTAVTFDSTATVTSTFTANGIVALGDGGDAITINGSDANITIVDGSTVNIDGDTSPTADLVQIGSGDTSATDGVDALQLTFISDDASGNIIDITPTFTDNDAGNTAETWNVIDVDALTVTQNDSGGAITGLVRGLNIGNLTESATGDDAITSNAIKIGTGWDSILDYNGTTIINGSGQVVSTQINGTIFSTNTDTASANTIDRGDTLTINGDANGIDVTHSGDTMTVAFDGTEVGAETWGTGSGFAWTFNSGTTDPVLTFGDNAITIGSAATITATDVTAFNCTDCIDFDDIVDNTSLDTDLAIAEGAGEEITINKTYTNNTAENGLVINLTASDTGAATTAQYGVYIDNLASTEGADALIALNNSDADDAIGTGILFTAGGAGTDFTYGINFDAANIGTAELVFSNSETIDNVTDNGSFIFTAAGETNNESLELDLETTANAASLFSSTGVVTIDLGSSIYLTNIGNAGTDFTATGGLTLDDILTVNDDLDIVLAAGENISITDSAAATADILSLIADANTTSDGIDGIFIDFRTGNGTNPTNNAINIDLTSGGGAGDTLVGLDLALSGTGGTEYGINFSDNNFDTDINATTDLTIGIGGTNEITLTGTNLAPSTAEGNSLGSATLEWEEVFVGDDLGVKFGLDQDWSLLYDEATDDRLELTTAGTTGVLIQSATATGTELNLVANSISTGTILQAESTSTALTTAGDAFLGYFDWTPGSATTAVGDLFRINIGANGNVSHVFNVTDAGSTLFSVAENQIESAVPHLFSAAGDVNIAYDLVFTNQTASVIDSYGPLTLRAGESFESNNLTLTSYLSGNILLNTGATAGKVGIGAGITPAGLLHVSDTGTGAIGKALVILDQDETQDILTASASGVTKFALDSSGKIYLGALDTETANTTATCWFNNTINGVTLKEITDCNGTPTDLAENFGATDASIEAGDVVISTGQAETVSPKGLITSKAFIAKSATTYEPKVLGVVSTAPNQVYGEDGLFDESENPRPVSLAGRVPTKVNLEGGPIKSGDWLTTSNTPGIAMKANEAGTVIGMALEDYNPQNPENYGKIIVFMNVGYQNPTPENAVTRQEIESLLMITEQNQALLEQSANWNTNTATTSGEFTEVITNDLFVTGIAALDSISVSQTITLNNNLVIGNGNIDSLTTPLNIQGSGAQALNFMSGKVTIDTSGNMVVNGNLKVLGTLDANKVNVSDQVAGTAKIVAGTNEVTILNENIKLGGLIFVTPTSPTKNNIYVKSQIEGQAIIGFDPTLVEGVEVPTETDINFNWWIVGITQ